MKPHNKLYYCIYLKLNKFYISSRVQISLKKLHLYPFMSIKSHHDEVKNVLITYDK